MASEHVQIIDEDSEEEEPLNSEEEERHLIQRTVQTEDKLLYRYKLFKSVCVVAVWICLVSVICVNIVLSCDVRTRVKFVHVTRVRVLKGKRFIADQNRKSCHLLLLPQIDH